MSKIAIIGAGMAGLLAGNMLRSHKPLIIEQSTELPNNHKALLRFRTDAVANAIGIPFKKVKVMKDVHMEGFHSNLAAALSYGRKVASSSSFRSILSALNGEICERFIAPDDLIQKMADGLTDEVRFDNAITSNGLRHLRKEGYSIISTIPMSVLCHIIDGESLLKHCHFDRREGTVIRATLEGVDVYASLYLPDPTDAPYRISITGNKLIIEYLRAIMFSDKEIYDQVEMAIHHMGMRLVDMSVNEISSSTQTFAKILPIPENERKRFIMWASEEHSIYSLGRFATWRPGLLLDDVVNDVRVIQQMILGNSNHSYNARKA